MVNNNNNIDMEIDTPRERSVNSSINSSRESSTHSNVSSISYVERMEAQNNDPSWTDQVNKHIDSQGSCLSYTDHKVGEDNICNEVTELENITIPHREKTTNYGTNICTPQGFDSTSILYAEITEPNS